MTECMMQCVTTTLAESGTKHNSNTHTHNTVRDTHTYIQYSKTHTIRDTHTTVRETYTTRDTQIEALDVHTNI